MTEGPTIEQRFRWVSTRRISMALEDQLSLIAALTEADRLLGVGDFKAAHALIRAARSGRQPGRTPPPVTRMN